MVKHSGLTREVNKPHLFKPHFMRGCQLLQVAVVCGNEASLFFIYVFCFYYTSRQHRVHRHQRLYCVSSVRPVNAVTLRVRVQIREVPEAEV